ncbi:MAG: PadR family transcriptional regulator [Gemmatimonadetes bacterium]|uniref:PadR family transcriptional regulator n=1 Tax=Candidatus Kutchimonas denitrificans TaxID=3056748 RepID=A0AAE4ZAV2_9BACT|nr:PadR family transcriptional regulator [Gemmatimonadota bacterium]NIR75757.1 PadR family transcriptional regulator [Candidatus Kutchimonas denitrificans]NIS00370.1 PadR family transcriptional regulator [Gemmatimonadota bacterium]NIT66029.1 PadR family transcriptional regulator [Gemmatimonadota bacterium]NIU53733.1 PadR family transcriptional regulator [Gemmatimonadota bacterium]
MFSSELKKGSVELLILSLLQHEPHHGYEIGKLIEARSGGRLQFNISSLYPILARMEKRGWVRGRWVEKAGERRRRYYELTKRGEEALEDQQEKWVAFAAAVNQVIGLSHA